LITLTPTLSLAEEGASSGNIDPVASGLFEAYLAGDARRWFGAHYADPADRQAAVRRARRPLAPEVARALEAQNARLAPSAPRERHLAALRAGAAAVVTGQQVGLFLGPLYTVYKAISAVRVADALSTETRSPVVPVFWLQSEDHDLAEIAECLVPCGDTTRAVSLPASAEDRVSIAHRSLPAAVTECLAGLHTALDGLPHVAAHLARLARHYRPGNAWVAAFAGVLGELFADAGLVVIDPRDPALASAAAAVHRRGLSDARAIAAGLEERVRELREAGFAAAVHVRRGAPLSFFHAGGADGPRHRLEPCAGGFAEVGGSRVYSQDALLAMLAEDPLRFSTSALQRPILQDALLPTAAYVGGPGEIAYFAQLGPLYAAYDLPMPVVVPRARCRVLDPTTSRWLARVGLQAADAGRPEAELLAAADAVTATRRFDRVGFERDLLAPFESALGAVEQRLEPAAGLDVAVEKTRTTVARAIARLADKVASAHARRDGAVVEAVRAIRSRLHPNGAPQERVHGLAYYAARFGERAFIARVRDAVEPFDATPLELTFEDQHDSPNH
jgi:bacillithiol biosynthesis cysteine-adding enzyme BshC